MAALAYYAEQKAKEMGWQSGTDYLVLTSTSIAEQANQIDEMIALKPAAIVLAPHNFELAVSAQRITAAGIPWVNCDRRVEAEYNAYVGGDNPGHGTESAKYIGKYITEKLNGQGTVAVMHVPAGGSVSTERVEAFKKEMAANYPAIRLIDVTASAFTQEAGLEMATDMLTANPKLDVVYSINDIPSLGVLQAVREANRKDVKLISGGGGAQAWFNNILNVNDIDLFTATYPPSFIKEAIQVAVDILAGKEVPKSTIVPTIVVDRTNVRDFLDPNSPY
jgi:ribose transport system substrate-binding protein